LRRYGFRMLRAHVVRMYHEIYFHVVWTTRNRARSIDRTRATYLQHHLPIIGREERCQVVELGVVSTHLHLLLRVHPTTALPRLLQRFKGGTAHGINNGSASKRTDLRWAKGYSVRSVGPGEVERVVAYIRNQHRHHPDEAIAGWPIISVASATPDPPEAGPAEPRLSAASRHMD
jgi:putative transposase